jgi:hypothetical protein
MTDIAWNGMSSRWHQTFPALQVGERATIGALRKGLDDESVKVPAL